MPVGRRLEDTTRTDCDVIKTQKVFGFKLEVQTRCLTIRTAENLQKNTQKTNHIVITTPSIDWIRSYRSSTCSAEANVGSSVTAICFFFGVSRVVKGTDSTSRDSQTTSTTRCSNPSAAKPITFNVNGQGKSCVAFNSSKAASRSKRKSFLIRLQSNRWIRYSAKSVSTMASKMTVG